MDYLKWSEEYMEEADVVLRNINRLIERQKSAPLNQRQTIADNIQRLKIIYYECVHTAAYLRQIAQEKRDAA